MISITIICGPTASGKSALAVALADERDSVIINADSMQIYDALHVLTAQPELKDLQRAPHRLYSWYDAAHKYSAQDWRNAAVHEIEQAVQAGRTPIIVGGTGLYLKALTHGLSEMPQVPEDIRAQGSAMQKQLGNPAFHAILAERDPVMAARLNPNDTQRLIRAWEVFEATGQSLATWQDTPLQGPPADWRFRVMITSPDRAELYARCDKRFITMMDLDVLDEVEALRNRIAAGSVPADAPITHALGFHPLSLYLDGQISRAEAITKAQTETRQYAKRQETWFRHQITPTENIEEIIRVP